MAVTQSCTQKIVPFALSNARDTTYFVKELAKAAEKIYPLHNINFTEITVFKAVVKQQQIENDNVLEWAELNTNSTQPTAKYSGIRGNSQQLFIYIFKNTPKDIHAAAFFSVYYNSGNECIGFGPAYFGIFNPGKNLISFNTHLSVKQNSGRFYLSPLKKNDLQRGLLFVSSDLKLPLDNSIQVQKVVLLDLNKIASYKPVVFNIADITHDPNTLSFIHQNTVPLAP